MSLASKIRFNSGRIGRLFKGESKSVSETTPPYIYRRSAMEEYTFDGGAVLLNQVPVRDLLEGHETEIQLWAGLAQALEEFRRKVYEQHAETSEFLGQVQSLLDTIMGKMTHAYEEITGGVRVSNMDGRFWVNNIDPRAVLTLFLSHPSDKRRCYLEGVLHKLALILEGKAGRKNSHGILAQVRALYQDIHDALQRTSDSNHLLLSAGNPHFAG